MDAINCMNFDYVASGHYANVVHPAGQMGKDSVLQLSQDMVPIFDTHLKILIFLVILDYQS